MKTFFAILPALFAAPAFAMSCGNEWVNEGQTTYQVEQMCGEPQSADRRTIYMTQVAGYENVPMTPRGAPGPSPVYVQVPVNIDEWIYTFGPNALMQKLTFQNDRLVGIESLGYGN